ncbi:hypothetical protein [Streptomyces sp. NPDC060002]|uniref:nuclear transport factor 2 family protein n=1 Tax=Streptomyces sp. NPDC060002 TaxID=3347033 RepID=UPI00367A6414
MRQRFPDATFDVRRALSEGDLVLLHSSGVLVPGAPGMAVFDIFRFQDGKTAERWDILQEVLAWWDGAGRGVAEIHPRSRRSLARRSRTVRTVP